jgi:hypothetical protein
LFLFLDAIISCRHARNREDTFLHFFEPTPPAIFSSSSHARFTPNISSRASPLIRRPRFQPPLRRLSSGHYFITPHAASFTLRHAELPPHYAGVSLRVIRRHTLQYIFTVVAEGQSLHTSHAAINGLHISFITSFLRATSIIITNRLNREQRHHQRHATFDVIVSPINEFHGRRPSSISSSHLRELQTGHHRTEEYVLHYYRDYEYRSHSFSRRYATAATEPLYCFLQLCHFFEGEYVL